MDKVLNVLKEKNFVTKKKFGQNFISDTNLLSAIVRDAEINEDDVVVEIGTGAGTLTSALAEQAKFVWTFEVDETLAPVLDRTLDGIDNIKVVFRDILKLKPDELKRMIALPFKVVANLPYYITSPVLFYFLENDFPLVSLTVMVQREVAMRMTAKHNTPDYGVLSLAVQSRADAQITRTVSRKMFYPEPNVDSAVVRLDLNEGTANREMFDKVVRCAFSCRRKTLVNNLMQTFGLKREDAEDIVSRTGQNKSVRGEALSKDQFEILSELLLDFYKK